MKNLLEVLDQKEREYRQLHSQVYALRVAAEILMEDEDREKWAAQQHRNQESEKASKPAKQWP